MTMTLFERLRQNAPSMSPAYRRIADYVAQNYSQVAFMPSSQLAACCDTHESNVVKFAVSLGYTGYPDLLRDIQEIAKTSMPPADDHVDDGDESFAQFRADLLACSEALASLRTDEGAEDFSALVDAARKAKRIFLVGFYGQSSLAEMAAFQLDVIGYRVTAVVESGIGLHRGLRNMTNGDLLIAFAYPPYLSAMRAAISLCKSRGAVSVVLTDRRDSPAGRGADRVLVTGVKSADQVAHVTGAASLIGALSAALALQEKDRALRSIRELEQILGNTNLYVN